MRLSRDRFQQARTVIGLRRLAADRRSRRLLLYLSARALLPSPRLRLRTPIAVNIRLGPRTYPVRLQSRTELSLLHEIGVLGEYAPADEIEARVIVDLGAHIGLATLRLLATHPNARVVAVEADPAMVERLRENVAGLPVTVVHAAICGESGARSFYRSDTSSLASSLEPAVPSQSSIRVPTLSLDDLLDSHEIERVDLLKLDVEGAEWELFEDGVPPRIRSIVGEIHPRGTSAPEEYIERLTKNSMQVRQLSAEEGRATFVATREAAS